LNSYNGFTAAERSAAYRWFKLAWASGAIVPDLSQCCACGQTEGWKEPHNEDYSKPYGPHLGAFVFCYRCHMLVHCRFRNAQVWDDYRAAVRLGLRAEALFTRDWWAVVRQLNGTVPEYTQHDPLFRQVLDEISSGIYLDRGGKNSAERRARRARNRHREGT